MMSDGPVVSFDCRVVGRRLAARKALRPAAITAWPCAPPAPRKRWMLATRIFAATWRLEVSSSRWRRSKHGPRTPASLQMRFKGGPLSATRVRTGHRARNRSSSSLRGGASSSGGSALLPPLPLPLAPPAGASKGAPGAMSVGVMMRSSCGALDCRRSSLNCLLGRSGWANTPAVVSTLRTLDHASSVRLKVRMLMPPKPAAWLGSLERLHLSRNCMMAKCTGSLHCWLASSPGDHPRKPLVAAMAGWSAGNSRWYTPSSSATHEMAVSGGGMWPVGGWSGWCC